jgi:hypothetical protein
MKGEYLLGRKAYDIQYREKNKEKFLKKERAQREKNKEKVNEAHRKYRRTLRGRFAERKKKCSQTGRSFTLSFEEYSKIVSDPCYYCNYNFGKPVEAGCGLDRLNSNLGYDLGNVVSCCKDCNTVKSDLITPDEMKAVMALILRMRSSETI